MTDEILKRDPSGAPAEGVKDDSTGDLIAVKGDGTLGGKHVCLHKWDSVGLEWVKWDGRMDTIVSGDLIVAVDDLEDLISAQQKDYKLSDWLVSGTDIYVGKLKADGAWIITKYATSTGQARYVSGSSGYDFSDPTSLSYDLYNTEF